ncbi:MAG TPA: RibD family protein [Hyphomicrobiales bacterium]|nr:RibD family protein [Hyphomicrobiales bacterium]
MDASLPWLDPADPLAAAYRPLAAAADRPFALAQLGQSLDGRIATASGASHFINGPAALDHLHRLRAMVDAVVVGVGTVIADDCRLTVRRVAGPNPARVVIDPHSRLPAGARVLAEDGVRRLVVTTAPADAPADAEIVVVPAPDGQLAPRGILDALAALGLRRVLVEGGAATVSGFLAAGALDRLHVLVAPVILGSGQPGVVLPPIDDLAAAIRPKATVYPLEGGDVLFDCDLRPGSVSSSGSAR